MLYILLPLIFFTNLEMADFFKDISKIGFKIFALDEEALTISSIEQYMKLNYFKNNEKYLNTFFLSNFRTGSLIFNDTSNPVLIDVDSRSSI